MSYATPPVRLHEGSRLTPSQLLRHNFRHLYADIFWYGVLAGSTLAFLTVYAARLGGTSFQIGLLSAGPAIVNLLLSIPSGKWLEGRPLGQTTFRSSILNRSAYPLLIGFPWLFAAYTQVQILIALTLLMSIPGTLLAISFNAMYADVVPPDWRAHVVGRRNALLAISVTLTSLISGRLLDNIAFPLNYQILFGVGALGAFLSTYHLGKIRFPVAYDPPARVGRPLTDIARPGIMRFVDAFRLAPGLRYLTRSSGRPLLRLDLLRGSYGGVLATYLLFHTFQHLPIPLFSIFFVNDLKLSDGVISLGNALFYGMMTLVSLRLGRISARLGHRRVFVVGGMLYGLFPLLNGLAKGPPLYLVSALLGGVVWALLNGGLVNRLMERIPDDDRPAHMALYNLALNLGVLLGSMLGPALGEAIGLRDSLLISAALRLLGGLLLILWG